MCINKEVSLTTFISSSIVAIYLWIRNYKYDKWFSLFLITFSSIQLWEFFLWMLQEKNQLGSNKDFILSRIIIPLTLILEPIVAYLGKIWYESKYKGILGGLGKELRTSYYPYVLLIYVIIFVWRNLVKKFDRTTVSEKGSLQWNNEYQTNYMGIINGFIFAFFLSFPFIGTIIYLPIFLFLSLVIALLVSDNFGSYWCFISNTSILLFLVYPYLIKN